MNTLYKVYDNKDNYLFHMSVSMTKCFVCPLAHIEIKFWREIDYYSAPQLFTLFYDHTPEESDYDINSVRSFLLRLRESSSIESQYAGRQLLSIGIDPEKFHKVDKFNLVSNATIQK
jgi:hypothetical protein